MAKHTDINLRSTIFYQVFPRQYSKTKNFEGVYNDLERIKALGTDILYFLPIHPIGKKARKGTKGSPYSIVDYYQIDPSYGTLEEFKKLIEKAHELDMKVMIDIVFNHTSRDSVLVHEHPEWFYHNEKGEFANRVGDWSDITDLDFNNHEVWDYLTAVLIYWAELVDGFRCDVAPLLPIDFWVQARNSVEKVNPKLIWLTESVHLSFVKYIRDLGYDCSSDSQMYEAFDICYDYDIYDYMNEYLKDPSRLKRWIEEINRQEACYPKNYIKLRSFENHDQPRLRSKVRDHNHFIMMLTMQFMLKGPSFIYAGEEHEVSHTPTLFEDDLIPWNKALSIESLISKLSTLKKDPIFVYGSFHIKEENEVVHITYQNKEELLISIINLEQRKETQTELGDGIYLNLFNDQEIIVKDGLISLSHHPIIIKTKKAKIK